MKSRRLRPTSAHSAEGTTTKQKKVKSKQSSNNATVSNKPAKTLVGEVSLKVLQNHPGSQITCEKVLNEMLVQVRDIHLLVTYSILLIIPTAGEITIIKSSFGQNVA